MRKRTAQAERISVTTVDVANSSCGLTFATFLPRTCTLDLALSLTLRRDTTSLREETQTNKHGRQSAAAVFRSFKPGAAANVTAAAATLIRTSHLPLLFSRVSDACVAFAFRSEC